MYYFFSNYFRILSDSFEFFRIVWYSLGFFLILPDSFRFCRILIIWFRIFSDSHRFPRFFQILFYPIGVWLYSLEFARILTIFSCTLSNSFKFSLCDSFGIYTGSRLFSRIHSDSFVSYWNLAGFIRILWDAFRFYRSLSYSLEICKNSPVFYRIIRIIHDSLGICCILSYSPAFLWDFLRILSAKFGSRIVLDSLGFFWILWSFLIFSDSVRLSRVILYFQIHPDSPLFPPFLSYSLTFFQILCVPPEISYGSPISSRILSDSHIFSNYFQILSNSNEFFLILPHCLVSCRFLRDSSEFSHILSEFDWILLNSLGFLGFFRILSESLGFWPYCLVYSRNLSDSLDVILSEFIRTRSYFLGFFQILP